MRTVNEAIRSHRVLELNYYKENEDQFTKREVEPYRLANGPEGWYVGCCDPTRDDIRHFKLDRIKEAKLTGKFEPRPELEDMPGGERWLIDGEVDDAKVARVWVSPERARWMREERTVVEELADGAVIVELPYAGTSWLVREIAQGRRRPGRARARGRPRGGPQGARGLTAAVTSRRWTPHPATRDRPHRRAQPGADDAGGHEHLHRRRAAAST